jgi:chromate transporter
MDQRLPPSCAALARGFMRIGISGFGGVLPYARYTIVDTEKWLTDRDFTELLSAGQLIPGPNIVNVAVMLGTRFRGWRGAAAAFCGLMIPPFIVFVVLAAVYANILEYPWVSKALIGVAAVAAGQIFSVGYRLGAAMPMKPWAFLLAAAAYLGVTVLHLPLPWVVVALAPLGMFCAARWRE